MSRQYIGARYVPVFADPLAWDSTKNYDALTIVQYNNDTYTSKKAVPSGTAITNTEYWVKTGNYNAQLQEYIEIASEADEKADEALERSVRKYRFVIVSNTVTTFPEKFVLPETITVENGECIKTTVYASDLVGTGVGIFDVQFGNDTTTYCELATTGYTETGSNKCNIARGRVIVGNSEWWLEQTGSYNVSVIGEGNNISTVTVAQSSTSAGIYTNLYFRHHANVTSCRRFIVDIEIG